jgi:hypothetical protein
VPRGDRIGKVKDQIKEIGETSMVFLSNLPVEDLRQDDIKTRIQNFLAQYQNQTGLNICAKRIILSKVKGHWHLQFMLRAGLRNKSKVIFSNFLLHDFPYKNDFMFVSEADEAKYEEGKEKTVEWKKKDLVENKKQQQNRTDDQN